MPGHPAIVSEVSLGLSQLLGLWERLHFPGSGQLAFVGVDFSMTSVGVISANPSPYRTPNH